MINRKVLLLSADSEQLSLLSSFLRNNGFEIISGRSGEAGLALANTENPDIIIADLIMPFMDGYQLYRALRSSFFEQFADTPFIFVCPNPSAISQLTTSRTSIVSQPTDDWSLRRFLRIVRKMLQMEVPPETEEEGPGPGKKILIFSRNADVANILRTCLDENAGYDVAVALDRDELLIRCESSTVSYLFLDISVSDEVSLEFFLRKLRLKNNSLGIIVLAEKDTTGSAVRLLQHGANDYLTIPFSEKEVNDSIRIVTEVINLAGISSAISNRISELNIRLQHRNLELTLLQKIAAELSHGDDPEELAEIILKGLRELVDYDVGTIMLLEGHTLRIVAAQGFPEEVHTLEMEFDTNANPRIRRVIQEKKALVFRDPTEVDPFDGILPVKKIHSCLIAPMCLAERMLGIFTLDKQVPGLYDDDTIRLVSTLAHHAAISFERAERHRTLETLAATDGLTGLYNRRSLDIAMAREGARIKRNGKPASIVMVDADGVKFVNDRFGHEAGDAFLRRIAHILRESCRVTDVVSRYGGDEFVVLMPETAIAGAQRFITLISRKIASDPGFQLGSDTKLTVSLGAACSTETGSIEDTLRLADERMYEDKRIRKASRSNQHQT